MPNFKRSDSVLFVQYAGPEHIIAAGVILPILGLLTILLRFHARRSRAQYLGIDDWLLLPAWLMITGMGICLIIGVKNKAFGYPTPKPAGLTTTAENLANINAQLILSQQLEFALTLLVVLGYSFIKFSILFFYRRLFSIRNNLFSFLSWLLISITALWTLAFFFLFIFSCGTHVSANWGSRDDLLKYCREGLKHEQSLYVSEFVITILLVVLPLPTIWNLNLPYKRKVKVTCILLLAFMALAASVVRLVLIIEVTTKNYLDFYDVNQTISTVFYWGMIEAGLALIACCLPVLKILFTKQGIRNLISNIRGLWSEQDFSTETKDSRIFTISSGTGEISTFEDKSLQSPASAVLTGRSMSEMEMEEDELYRVEEARAGFGTGRIGVRKEVEVVVEEIANEMSQQCYYPDGSVTGADTDHPLMIPCSPSASNSACCHAGDVCYENGLCMSAGWWFLYRGGCTDKSFQSSSCPSACTTSTSGGLLNSYQIINTCEDPHKLPRLFTCSDTNAGCSSGNFSLPEGTILAVNLTANATTISSSSLSITTASLIVPSSSSVSHTTSSTIAPIQAGAAATFTSSSTLQTPTNNTNTPGISPLAFGFALGLTLLLSIFLAILLFLEHKKRVLSEGKTVLVDPSQTVNAHYVVGSSKRTSYEEPKGEGVANGVGERGQEFSPVWYPDTPRELAGTEREGGIGGGRE
ncbi:hypothetical protein G7Y89_g10325 [Cudoniella acicularis]|uniref:Rhodopsin domain-containing protein n=1 Tax=Cudoniella acicularis TaxID=354080 RepID=A0A8H4VZ59_9HELO|nr:hypothetical protein G7Y89_g10325 [Cudoniella acicularis]